MRPPLGLCLWPWMAAIPRKLVDFAMCVCVRLRPPLGLCLWLSLAAFPRKLVDFAMCVCLRLRPPLGLCVWLCLCLCLCQCLCLCLGLARAEICIETTGRFPAHAGWSRRRLLGRGMPVENAWRCFKIAADTTDGIR